MNQLNDMLLACGKKGKQISKLPGPERGMMAHSLNPFMAARVPRTKQSQSWQLTGLVWPRTPNLRDMIQSDLAEHKAKLQDLRDKLQQKLDNTQDR